MTTAAEKWARLERLQAVLASGDPLTTADLADAAGVSRRTVVRDLAALRDQGVLVECDRGRGGGVRLASGQSGGRIRLKRDEAMDLLAALALADRLGSPFSVNASLPVRQKLASVFAPADREAIRALRRRILVGGAASARTSAQAGRVRSQDLRTIRDAFIERRILDVTYLDTAGRRTARRIEAHYLLLNPPVWYVLAWDHLRQAVRAFRFDRILAAQGLDRRFSLRPAAPFLEAVEAGVEPL